MTYIIIWYHNNNLHYNLFYELLLLLLQFLQETEPLLYFY